MVKLTLTRVHPGLCRHVHRHGSNESKKMGETWHKMLRYPTTAVNMNPRDPRASRVHSCATENRKYQHVDRTPDNNLCPREPVFPLLPLRGTNTKFSGKEMEVQS